MKISHKFWKFLAFSEFFSHFFSKYRDSFSFPEHFCEIPAKFHQCFAEESQISSIPNSFRCWCQGTRRTAAPPAARFSKQRHPVHSATQPGAEDERTARYLKFFSKMKETVRNVDPTWQKTWHKIVHVTAHAYFLCLVKND